LRFDERFLDEIKSRVRLSDVIGRSVKLRRQGREYAGLSPFSKEKTPSFFVNDDKGFWHDFSSGKHGDLISFLQETERLSFTEAVERLAAEAGVPLQAPDPRAAEETRKRQGLSDWLDLAAAWYEDELKRPGGREARDYLKRRGLGEAEWARFRIGYAPGERTRLKDYLIAKGARPAELVEAGLLIAPDDGGAPYDRFRERIMFPIADGRGRMVSFGGRALNPDAKAKYLNGPDTSLFDKSRTLYGLPEARRLLHAGGDAAPLVVVEGYMDVIACQRADIPAVAPMGTSLTEQQMELLWRQHPEPTLAFDADNAGRRAAARAIDRALPHLKPGKSFRFAAITGGKDADDVLREQGSGALKQQLSRTVPFVEALFVRERDLEPLDTPERRTAFKARLRQAAASIGEKDLADAYRDDLFKRMDELFPRGGQVRNGGFQPGPRRGQSSGGAGRSRWAQVEIPMPAGPEAKAARRSLAASLHPVAAAVAKAAIAEPHWLDDLLETVQDAGFGDPQLDDLAREIIRLRLEGDLDTDTLTRHLAGRGFSAQLRELDKAAEKSGAPFLDPDLSPAAARALWSHAFSALTRLAALESALISAKAEAADAGGMSALMRLKGERDALRRVIKTGTIWTDDGS
jgi:DNA primase